MTTKTSSIVILSITAVVLLLANFSMQQPAVGATAIKDRDFQLVTSKIQGGGEGLYVIDNRTGVMAIFSFEPGANTLRPRAVRPVAEAFR